MARIYDPTPQQEASWRKWVADRPLCVRAVAERFQPWNLYRMKDTGHRVTLVSFGEDGTMRVFVSAKFNLVAFERQVFGVDPDSLEECDLPDLRSGVPAKPRSNRAVRDPRSHPRPDEFSRPRRD